MKISRCRKGFTLIELLVVISIIALLLAILIPALARVKEEARRVVCASFLHQFALAVNTYSHDYNGRLPSFPSPSGPHVHDLAEEFVFLMKESYGFKYEDYFCPSMPGSLTVKILNYPREDGSHFITGYSYWVPRFVNSYSTEIPPKQSTSLLTVIDTNSYSGPKKTDDFLGKVNPIMTDQVSMSMTNPPDSNISDVIWGRPSCHQWNNIVEMTNQVFVDGHVEKVDKNELKVRYGYGSSPTGIWIWR